MNGKKKGVVNLGYSIVSIEAQKCNGDGDENDTRGPLNTALEEEGRSERGRRRDMYKHVSTVLLARLLLGPEKLTELYVRPHGDTIQVQLCRYIFLTSGHRNLFNYVINPSNIAFPSLLVSGN